MKSRLYYIFMDFMYFLTKNKKYTYDYDFYIYNGDMEEEKKNEE